MHPVTTNHTALTNLNNRKVRSGTVIHLHPTPLRVEASHYQTANFHFSELAGCVAQDMIANMPDVRWGETGVSDVVIKDPNSVDMCVLYPSDATDEELETIWVCAEEGDYIAINDTR